MGVIQSPPQLPVLADGLFPHYTKPASPATYEADIPLPNITCPKCTLQVIQFMAEHAYTSRAAIRPAAAPTWRSPPIPPSRSTRAGRRRQPRPWRPSASALDSRSPDAPARWRAQGNDIAHVPIALTGPAAVALANTNAPNGSDVLTLLLSVRTPIVTTLTRARS